MNTLYTYISFGFYLLLMLLIGVFFYKRTDSLSGYVLGERKLNPWVTSLSAQASDMSGWLLLGLPGYAYLSGLESIWLLFALILGTYVNWRFVAERLRIFTANAKNSITIPDYFQNRFASSNTTLRILSSIFILFFFIIYTSSGFVAGAKLFSSVFEIPYFHALVIGTIVIVSYTFLGGFLAVSWTDVIQGTIMFFAVIIVPLIGILNLGGFEKALILLIEGNENLINPMTNNLGEPLSIIAILSLFGWGIGYFGQPHILARFMAINNPNEISQARKIAMTWVIVSLIFAVVIGMIGNLVLNEQLVGVESEKVFINLVNLLVSPYLAGFLLAAILAAIMSTADSQLLVATSSVTEDIYRPFIRPKATENELVWVSRVILVIIAVIAFSLALDENSSVLNLVSYAWAGFGATFGPVILFSLYWKRMTYLGAVGGVVSGGLTIIIWQNLEGGIFELYEIIPAFLISSMTILLISYFDKKIKIIKSEEIYKRLHQN